MGDELVSLAKLSCGHPFKKRYQPLKIGGYAMCDKCEERTAQVIMEVVDNRNLVDSKGRTW